MKILKDLFDFIPFLNLYPIWAQIIIFVCLIIIGSILIFVPRKTPPAKELKISINHSVESEFPEFIVNGVLPVCTIKKRPDLQMDKTIPIPEEYGLYFIIEVSSKKQSVNLGSLEIEGQLFLNWREYAFYLEKNLGKKPPELIEEISERKPYFEIKWIAWLSRPKQPKLDIHQNALFLYTLQKPDIMQERNFLSKDGSLDAYIGYVESDEKPKWENTHPNLQEFAEINMINNNFSIIGLREDFRNGNIKYFLKIGDKKIPIPQEKIKNLKVEYLKQKEDIMQISLEEIYYRTIY